MMKIRKIQGTIFIKKVVVDFRINFIVHLTYRPVFPMQSVSVQLALAG